MARKIVVTLLFLFIGAMPATGVVRQFVNVPLEYNYLPGEPFWAKYGAIDGRNIDVWIGSSEGKYLGNFIIEGAENFILVPRGDLQQYLDKAVSSVLTGYGVSVRKGGPYRLIVTPELIDITTADSDEDGDKLCTVRLWAEYFSPDTTRLFTALIQNQGTLDVDDDDEIAYADLLDRTLHGAIVKIWGSQILYTTTSLGTGMVKKIDRGTFAFVADSIVRKPEGFPPAGTIWRSSKYSNAGVPGICRTLPPDAELPTADHAVITGSDGNDTVVVVSGRRISVGILPFENATGSERLTALVKSAQERFSATLGRSGTIRIMERGRLSDILREQALGMSGIMNDSTVVKVGNISGLQVMVAGNVTTAGSYYRMSARIINVETSVIVASSSLLVPDALQIDDAGAELAAQLLFKFTEEKLDINRNTMAYPSVVPRAQPAATASVEDAWAVEYNPAAIMKVTLRDAAFFTTFAEKLSGKTTEGRKVSTVQPPYSTMGLHFAYPINGFIGTGFGIKHFYQYPRLSDRTVEGSYDFREEGTAFTLPAAVGITPKLSFGASVIANITEYTMVHPGRETIGGSSITASLMFGTLVKLSERFRMAATYASSNIYEKTDEKTGSFSWLIERPSAHKFRIGTAMYPIRWFFFFADLEYRKYEQFAQLQPGFHLGAQLTVYGRPKLLSFLPQYGMIPLYIGYSHEPYDRVKNLQSKYFSFGSGYNLNNIYFQWAWRVNAEGKGEKNIVLGSGDGMMRLSDYSYSAPLFVCMGFRF